MRRLGLVGLLTALLLGVAGPAFAVDVTEYWRVTIDVQADGSFNVTEVIGQRFNQPRRGIFRYIPVTERVAEGGLVEVPDGDAGDWFQRIRIDDLKVRVTTAPDDTQVTRPSRHDPEGLLVIRIGQEDTYVAGLHEYRITYRVEGAMLPGPDGTSLLRWDVVGNGWEQDITEASVEVNAPGGILPGGVCAGGSSFAIGGTLVDGGCVLGPASTTSFDADIRGLPSYSPMSVQVPFDAAFVRPSEPILQQRFTLTGALWGDARAIPAALALGALLLWRLVTLLFREGRDRVSRGDITVDGRLDTANTSTEGMPRRLLEPRAVGVEFRPPDGLRPGQLGLILDERVDPVDVSATVVDLAVRGHLVIEEVEEGKLWWSRTDWKLKRTGADRGDLRGYEKDLLGGLVGSRAEVMVGDLKGTFSTDYAKVESSLYEEGRTRHWFAGRPDKVRAKWLGLAIGSLIGWMLLFGFGMYWTRAAIIAVPGVLASFVLLVAHRRMPRRTPAGSELLTRTLGFRQFIETAEKDRAQFAEKEHLFVEYLPYAVVFGATDKWAKAFEGIGIAAAVGGVGYGTWYVSSRGGMFDARSFSSGLSDFSSSLGTAAVTAPPSSSGGGGGFSGGGGFGGGGGGSW